MIRVNMKIVICIVVVVRHNVEHVSFKRKHAFIRRELNVP